MPGIKEIKQLPSNILNKLKVLDEDLKEEDITIKGYCKKKWELLQEYATENIVTKMEQIQLCISQNNINRDEAYNQMLDLLRIENIFIADESDEETKNKSQLKSNKNKRKFVSDVSLRSKKIKVENEVSIEKTRYNTEEIKKEQCKFCEQDLKQIKKVKKQSKNAVEELVALTNSKLMLFNGNESDINQLDVLPHNKITNFSVYDKEGHLCSFDSGLIEKNVSIYFSGVIKPIYDENPSSEGGIIAKDLGPIEEWWTTGFDGGKHPIVGFTTSYGEYYLMKPSPEYNSFMIPFQKKVSLAKLVVEYLLKNNWKNPSYADLLSYLQNTEDYCENDLLEHAQFICNQVISFDEAIDEEKSLIDNSCMKTLVDLCGVTFNGQKALRTKRSKIEEQYDNDGYDDDDDSNTTDDSEKIPKRKKNWTKAATTDLVRNVFESYFPEQLDKQGNSLKKNDTIDANYEAKPKRQKKIKITNLEFENFFTENSSMIVKTVNWISEPVAEIFGKTFYSSAMVNNFVVKSGNFVLLSAKDEVERIAKVAYMWEESSEKYFHAHFFCRGSDTILGEISDVKDIFEIDECDKCLLTDILNIVQVQYGDLINNNNNFDFFCRKRYDRSRGRFVDLQSENVMEMLGCLPCVSCKKKSAKKLFETPILENDCIVWRNQQYGVGTGVYLLPGTFSFKTAPLLHQTKKEETIVNEELYPEYYRKKTDTTIGIEISEPFCIGYITEILTKPSGNQLKSSEIILIVQKLYRPENTHKGISLSQQLDLNHLYWSEEEVTVNFSKVMGQCYITFADILNTSVEEWSAGGPDRFYFSSCYKSSSHEFVEVKGKGRFVGRKKKSNSDKYKSKKSSTFINKPEKWIKLKEPLRTMDVFAGCGGLSEGLHQSGVANTKWAIEKEEAAAEAFKLNNPNTIVYSEDCNHFLNRAMSGHHETESGQPIPVPGDVDLLVGGPPCQGFSGMNRFNAGQYSLFKNSLIVSFLSYCDYYRPRFFILENVRNFVTFKRSIVLKLTLKCLLTMGYQCSFGILQAGNFGVPQIRRRLILFAAAPGEILPEYPEPLHVFNSKRANPLDLVIDGRRYNTGSKWMQISAPYRTITVRDAMSDLPVIKNGCSKEIQAYDSDPISHFQRLMRLSSNVELRDHICKEMATIVLMRISYIPTAPGSDWRDLPNIVVTLPDGTKTNKLEYKFHDKRNGKSSTGALRGVCPCASKKSCDPSERQLNTLIPWCLPHTANRHNNWTGLYGRLEWNGVFNTTVTNPEPMGKQGRILHPEQHRVVSVRECARSQGFPDKYQFTGNLMSKHRQVGNAVPPPLGKAIGRQILKSIAMKTNNTL